MGEAKPAPEDSATSKADAMALLEEAKAEAAEAEALAAAEAEATEAEASETESGESAEGEAESAETAEAETAEAETADEQAPDADESDSETDEEAAEETVEAAAPESRLGRWRRRLPSLSATSKVAAIILICAFVCASGYILWQDHDATERRQRAANFVAGAKQGVVNMMSLDFNRAKEDVQRLLDSSTGQFRDDFQQRAKDFVSVVEES